MRNAGALAERLVAGAEVAFFNMREPVQETPDKGHWSPRRRWPIPSPHQVSGAVQGTAAPANVSPLSSLKRAPKMAVTSPQLGDDYNNLIAPELTATISWSTNMTRREGEELERKLEQARKQALEPQDARTIERIAQQIEELEYQLLANRLATEEFDLPTHSNVKPDRASAAWVGVTNS